MRSSIHRWKCGTLALTVLATGGCAIWLGLVTEIFRRTELATQRNGDSSERSIKVGNLRVLDRLPIRFEPNKGQWEQQVVYRSRSLLKGGYEMELRSEGPRLIHEIQGRIETVDLRFPGADRAASIEGLDRQPGDSNYFIGNDAQHWVTSLPGYRRVIYRAIYPGIDLLLYGQGSEIEFDFVVAPGADPRRIRIELIREGADRSDCGSDQIRILEDGGLTLTVQGGEIKLQAPHIYQQDATGRRIVDGGYLLDQDNRVSFHLGQYDPELPLVIDPIIVNSSFIGGGGQDTPYSMTQDAIGNIYIAGQTRSSNLPVRFPYDGTINGQSDGFVMKVNPTATTVLAATYLGGRNPGDRILDVEVDSEGRIYVCGETSSLSFPSVNPFQSTYSGNIDGFVSILSSNGSQLLFSSFLGGSSLDTITGLAVDAERNIYLTGGTRSANFPIIQAIQPDLRGQIDAFVARVDRNGDLVFSTFLGGQDAGIEENEEETGLGIALDPLRNIYLTGVTSSSTFPLVTPLQRAFGGVVDCFVVKMQSDGQRIIYSTYLGGGRADAGRAIAIDSFGQAVITGYTYFSDFPIVNAFQPVYRGNLDAFVAKLAANGQRLIFSSFLGGSDEENSGSINDSTPVGSIAIDRLGNIYIGGKTSSLDFPLVLPLQSMLRGETDGFICKLDPAGAALLFSTYLGSSAADSISGDERVTGIAVDGRGVISVTGSTSGTDFPIVLPFQSNYGGGISDGFLSSVATPDISSVAAVSAASYNGSAIAPDSFVALFGLSLAGETRTAATIPLPTVLADTKVEVEDSAGVRRVAGLFFVSPEQINLQIPPGTSRGTARITVINPLTQGNGGSRLRSTVRIEQIAPAIFTANADGTGVPAGIIQRVRGNVTSFEPIAEISFSGRFEPKPIELGPEGDEVYLLLFGTGWRGASSDSQVVVRIGGVVVPVYFAGPQGDYVALDQLNIRLPRELLGRREVELSLEVDGMIANIVRLYIS